MRTWLAKAVSCGCEFAQTLIVMRTVAAAIAILGFGATSALAQSAHEVGGEASLKLPDLSQVLFLGIDGHRLLMIGILFCIFGLAFGLVIFVRLRNLPVHRAMLEISELIYETCKTYLITQGKFLMVLWLFIGAIAAVYFGALAQTTDATGAMVRGYPAPKVAIILLFSLVGIAGSYGVAWFGIRVNTFANSRTAFA